MWRRRPATWCPAPTASGRIHKLLTDSMASYLYTSELPCSRCMRGIRHDRAICTEGMPQIRHMLTSKLRLCTSFRLLRRVAEAFKLKAEAAAELLPPKAQLALARFSPPSRAGQQPPTTVNTIHASLTHSSIPYAAQCSIVQPHDLCRQCCGYTVLSAAAVTVATWHDDRVQM